MMQCIRRVHFRSKFVDYDFEMETEATYNMDDIDPEREAYYKDDPKKVLKKYFDREGMHMKCIYRDEIMHIQCMCF